MGILSNELSLGANFINNNDCLCFGQLLWPSFLRAKSENFTYLFALKKEDQSSWPKHRQSLLFMKLVSRGSSFDMQEPTEKLPLHGHLSSSARLVVSPA